MKRTSLSSLTLVAAALFAGACATHNPGEAPRPPAKVSTPPVAPAPPPLPGTRATTSPPPGAPRPSGAARAGDGLHWFRAAAEYRAIAISTYRAAAEAVTNAVQGKAPDSWAVILDADETVIDNSVFQRDLARNGTSFSEENYAAFVRQHVSVAVPGAKAFLDRVKALGGRIAIVTNRWSYNCEDMKEIFRIQKLPFDVMLCRVDTGDKSPRRDAVADGAAFGDGQSREVVAFVGDNILDFPGLDQSARDEPESAFDAFGERFFMLPNPIYGSWQQVPAR